MSLQASVNCLYPALKLSFFIIFTYLTVVPFKNLKKEKEKRVGQKLYQRIGIRPCLIILYEKKFYQ